VRERATERESSHSLPPLSPLSPLSLFRSLSCTRTRTTPAHTLTHAYRPMCVCVRSLEVALQSPAHFLTQMFLATLRKILLNVLYVLALFQVCAEFGGWLWNPEHPQGYLIYHLNSTGHYAAWEREQKSLSSPPLSFPPQVSLFPPKLPALLLSCNRERE